MKTSIVGCRCEHENHTSSPSPQHQLLLTESFMNITTTMFSRILNNVYQAKGILRLDLITVIVSISILMMNIVVVSCSDNSVNISTIGGESISSSSNYQNNINSGLLGKTLNVGEYIHSLFRLDSSTPNYNASLSTNCHPFLFNGGFSREEKPEEIYGLCPDTIFTPIISAVFYLVYLIISLVSFVGLVWKWKSRHITERHPLSLLFSLTGNFLFESILSIRFIVGRSMFPCILYSSVYFLFAASISLPTTYKCFRLFFKFKLSKAKIDLFTLQKELSTEHEMLSKYMAEVNPNSINQSNVLPTSTKEIERKKKFIKIYSFLLSAAFLIPMVCILVVLNVILWIAVGVSDEVAEKKLFFVDGGTFTFDKGCSVEKNTSILVSCEAVVYMILETIFVVLCIRTDKDIWSIKKETLAVVVIQIIFCLIYVISSQIDIVLQLVDYIIPFGTCMLFYCAIDQFVTIFLPILYSVRYDSKKNEEISMEVAIKLKEGDTYEELLDVARRGYHPEQMFAWYDIELFKTGKVPITKETALQIINLYLLHGSPLDINVPKHFDISILVNIANTSPFIPRDMFDGVQSFCFNDICSCLNGHNGAKFAINEKTLDVSLWSDY